LGILAGATAIAFGGCLFIGLIYGNTPEYKATQTARALETEVVVAALATERALPTSSPTLAPTETLVPTATQTPQPLPTATPLFVGNGGPYPTPQPDLYREIVKNHREMTDLQFDDYRENLRGRRIHLEGEIVEVYADGRVLIALDGDGLIDTMSVEQIPHAIALLLTKDSLVSLDATIQEVGLFLGALSTTCHDPVIYWIK
jgi:hypothetical protein